MTIKDAYLRDIKRRCSCVETKSTEPSKRFSDTNLTVWIEASEISVYKLSHAADFSRRTCYSTPAPPAKATINPVPHDRE